MSPEIISTERKVQQSIDQVEHAIEEAGKRRAFDIRLNEFNEKCENVIDSFVEWQNCLIDLNEAEREKAQKETFNITYDFLAFLEEQLVDNLFDLVIKNCPGFIRMFNLLGMYCHKVKAKYKIETSAEKQIQKNPELHAILKAYLK